MASIYKLVAERRDRNQSMKRKRKDRNINLFKESIEEVQYRRPILQRNLTMRQRTVSDQPGQDLPPAGVSALVSNRRPTSDVTIFNIKNQVNDINTKVDSLSKKIDELAKSIIMLKKEINKNQ